MKWWDAAFLLPFNRTTTTSPMQDARPQRRTVPIALRLPWKLKLSNDSPIAMFLAPTTGMKSDESLSCLLGRPNDVANGWGATMQRIPAAVTTRPSRVATDPARCGRVRIWAIYGLDFLLVRDRAWNSDGRVTKRWRRNEMSGHAGSTCKGHGIWHRQKEMTGI